MKIKYTQKLYFGKYFYKISVEAKGYARSWWHMPSEVNVIVDWCNKNLDPQSYKMNRRHQRHDENACHAIWHVCIYCADTHIKDSVIKQFGAQVTEICQPFDQEHETNLSVKNVIQVRKDLIYKKFRHVVYFKYDRKGELHRWLKNYFHDDPKARVSGSLWWSKVYMEHDLELATLQLSWGDQIDYIKTVRLLNEDS